MRWLHRFRPATKYDIFQLERRMNAQQTEIDNLTATVTAQTAALAGVKTEIENVNVGIDGLDTQVTGLAKEVADLKAAQQNGTPLDLSKLESAVSDIQVTVSGVKESADKAAANIAEPPAPAPPAA